MEEKINYYFSFVFVKTKLIFMLSGKKYEIKIKYVTIKYDHKNKMTTAGRVCLHSCNEIAYTKCRVVILYIMSLSVFWFMYNIK